MLVGAPDRMDVATGDVLSSEDDPVLQALVAEAATLARTPIAAVSLVLERTQLFRAQIGLPADLAATRATDRDASFCQLVVRDGRALTVENAAEDPRVPQELVDAYAVRAYHGEPVYVGGKILGTLCVIDDRRRAFTADQCAGLAALARRVSDRLDVLAAVASRDRLTHLGLTPAFASLRNLLMPLATSLGEARIAAVETRALLRLVQHVATHGAVPAVTALAGTAAAIDDLEQALADADGVARDLRDLVVGLQAAVISTSAMTTVGQVEDLAVALAEHETKLVGGVTRHRHDEPTAIAVAMATAASVISAGLVTMARSVQLAGGDQGLDLHARLDDRGVTFAITAGDLAGPGIDEAIADLRGVTQHEPAITVAGVPGGLTISMPRS